MTGKPITPDLADGVEPEHRATETVVVGDLPRGVAVTLAENRLYHVDFEASDGYNDDTVRTDRPAAQCNVVTSEVITGPAAGTHRLLIDLDVEAVLIPSSTAGHSHLYVDVAAPWPAVVKVLDALAEAGVVEAGYVNASKTRGHTALRMPGVVKAPRPEPPADPNNPPPF